VGSTNPTVHLSLLTISTGDVESVPVDAFAPDDLIIGEVAWVTDTNTQFIYRAFNRVQDLDAHVVVDTATLSSSVVRERDGTDGWLENTATISYVGPLESSSNSSYYID